MEKQKPYIKLNEKESYIENLKEEKEYINSMSSDHKAAYQRKLNLSDHMMLPDPYALEGWHQNIKKLPSITLWDISHYLIYSPSPYTQENIKNYKSLEAYNFFVAGHVHDVYMHDIRENSDFVFIKTRVRSV